MHGTWYTAHTLKYTRIPTGYLLVLVATKACLHTFKIMKNIASTGDQVKSKLQQCEFLCKNVE